VWLERYRSLWEDNFQRLDTLLEELKNRREEASTDEAAEEIAMVLTKEEVIASLQHEEDAAKNDELPSGHLRHPKTI